MKLRVLLIDDDVTTNTLHSILLKQLNLFENIHISQSIFESITLLETIPEPNYIFLDLNLPKANGWDFLNYFEKKFPLSQTKIIILSSSIYPKDLEKSQIHPLVKHFISKPLNKEKLHSLFENYVERKI